ncbi:MAG: hypothetical protein WC707_05330 [Candidatus Babeliaceae bacterium]
MEKNSLSLNKSKTLLDECCALYAESNWFTDKTDVALEFDLLEQAADSLNSESNDFRVLYNNLFIQQQYANRYKSFTNIPDQSRIAYYDALQATNHENDIRALLKSLVSEVISVPDDIHLLFKDQEVVNAVSNESKGEEPKEVVVREKLSKRVLEEEKIADEQPNKKNCTQQQLSIAYMLNDIYNHICEKHRVLHANIFKFARDTQTHNYFVVWPTLTPFIPIEMQKKWVQPLCKLLSEEQECREQEEINQKIQGKILQHIDAVNTEIKAFLYTKK